MLKFAFSREVMMSWRDACSCAVHIEETMSDPVLIAVRYQRVDLILVMIDVCFVALV